MTTKKKPPMAKAVREFVTGMQFPPAPKHGPNPNIDLAAFVVAMLQHSTGLKEDATTATCSPSLSQIAEMLHGTNRSIERRLQELRDLGLLTQKGRGHASTLYTFHQRRQQLTGLETTTVVVPEQSQRRQLSESETTTPISETTTVVVLRGKASGVHPQEKQKPSGEGTRSGGGSFSNDAVPQTGTKRIPQTSVPPAGATQELWNDAETELLGYVIDGQDVLFEGVTDAA